MPSLSLTPGTRSGIIRDEAFSRFLLLIEPLRIRLGEILEQQERAEEEQASREMLKTIRRAFQWSILEGSGKLEHTDGEICTFIASDEPGLTRLHLTTTQFATECTAEALVTTADSIAAPDRDPVVSKTGMPGSTFEKAAGELWRSRFDESRNLIVINSGHHDFVYASAQKALKLRYIVRLFCKELVFRNFPGYSPDQLLERLVELSLYTESRLK